MNEIIKLLKHVNLWKTVYFNFHYFPFKTAIKMPVLIYWRSELFRMRGKIIIDTPVTTGMVKFGAHDLGTIDLLFSRTMWEVLGTIIIKGEVRIGRGSKISVGKDGVLTLGSNFTISGNSEIICHKQMTFGKDCLLSWDILIMDSDSHYVIDEKGEVLNPPKPVTIGDHVWIGCRTTILKGVSVASDNIISANSTITKSIQESHCAIGGHGSSVSIIKRGCSWKQ